MVDTTKQVKERKLTEREEPKFVQFQAEGDCVTGVLRSIMPVTVSDKRTVRFTLFNEEENKAYCFLATHQLLQLISRADVGKYMEVTFLGKDPNVVRNNNAMSKFRVAVDEGSKRQQPEESLQITDEDIPF